MKETNNIIYWWVVFDEDNTGYKFENTSTSVVGEISYL